MYPNAKRSTQPTATEKSCPQRRLPMPLANVTASYADVRSKPRLNILCPFCDTISTNHRLWDYPGMICYGLEKGDYILRVARFANLPLNSSGNETSLFHSKHIKLTCRQNVSIWCLKVELRTGEAASDSNSLAAS